MNLILIDCDPGYAAEWNRWYDMDHLPEFLGLPGVVAAHRYFASQKLQGIRPAVDDTGLDETGLDAPTAAYCTVIMVGPDSDAGLVGRAGMAATHNRLMGVPGRMPDWDRIFPRYIEGFDLADVVPAPTVPVIPDALLHLAHRGLLVELFDTSEPERTEAWFKDVHLPGLVAGDGILAAASFHPAVLPPVEAPWVEGAGEPSGNDGTGATPPVVTPSVVVRLLVVALLEASPGQVADALRARSDASIAAAVGSGTGRRHFHGVFDMIQPLDYGFLSEERLPQEVLP